MPEPPATRRDVERLLTFVDAVVAIAITLLVLPLVDLAGEVGVGGSAHLLRTHLGELGAFALSFVVIARLWWAQHRVVRHLVGVDPAVVSLLLGWALSVVFLPFPTALVAQDGDSAATKLLYIGSLVVSMVVLAALARLQQQRPGLTSPGEVPPTAGVLVNAVLLALALGLTLVVPALGYAPLLLLAVDEPALAAWRAVRRVVGR